MTKNNIIIGGGQVGTALSTIFTDCEVLEKDTKRVSTAQPQFMHIAFPYDEGFVDEVKRYVELYKPAVVIIHSTVKVGTTDELVHNSAHHTHFVYSFMIGQHDALAESLKVFPKWVSGCCEGVLVLVGMYFNSFGLNHEIRGTNTKELELGKLLSTTRYAMEIAFAQEQDRICKHYGTDYKRVVWDFEFMYDSGTMEMGKAELLRPLITPGIIAGHCLMPNVKILQSMVSSRFINLIEESNEARKETR